MEQLVAPGTVPDATPVTSTNTNAVKQPMDKSSNEPGTVPVKQPFAVSFMGLANGVKVAIAIALFLVLAYIIYQVKQFMNSPVGKAVSKTFGALAAAATGLLGKLSNLPLGGLIALGLAFALGPALLGLAGTAYKAYSERAVKASETQDTSKSAAEQKAEAAATVDELLKVAVNEQGGLKSDADLQESINKSANEVDNAIAELTKEYKNNGADPDEAMERADKVVEEARGRVDEIR